MPETLGNYELIRPLAKGGMGEVWVARQVSLDRQVAVKVLKPELTAQPQFRERFEREAKILAKLEHPRIVRVIDRGEASGRYYLVMGLVDGRPLDKLLVESPPDGDEAFRIVSDVGEALSHAHRQNVLHRDVKPQNILVDTDGRASVVDFGIALLKNDGSQHDTVFAGTRAYAAPEQLRNPSSIDARADQYALAAVYYQLLLGRPPARSSADPSKESASVSPALGQVIRKALSEDPRERFESVEEFLKAAARARRLGSVAKRKGSGALAAYKNDPGPLGAAMTTTLTLAIVYVVLLFLHTQQLARGRQENPDPDNSSQGGQSSGGQSSGAQGSGQTGQQAHAGPGTGGASASQGAGSSNTGSPAPADEHWQAAVLAGQEARWSEAADLYDIFVERYADDPRVRQAAGLARLVREYLEVEAEAEDREELRQFYDVHRLLSDLFARAPEEAPFLVRLRLHMTEVANLAVRRFNDTDVPAALAALAAGHYDEAREAVSAAMECGVPEIDQRASSLYAQIRKTQEDAASGETADPGVIDLGPPAAGRPDPARPQAAGQPVWTPETLARVLTETRVTLEVRRTGLAGFLENLARESRLPFKLDPAYNRPGVDVTGSWRDTPVAAILDEVLLRADLKLFVTADALVVQDKPKAWTEVLSRHYKVKTDCSPELAREVGKLMDRMFQEYTRRFRFRFQIRERLNLTVYSRTADFDAFMGKSGYAGVYMRNGTKKELAATHQRGWEEFTNTLYHEGCHQFIDFHIKEPPTWLNEGLACFFGPSRFAGEEFQLGLVDDLRLWAVRAAYSSNTNLPLRDVVNSTYDQFHDREKEGLMYATSWLLVHYLVRGHEGQHQPILGACINEMSRGKRVDFDKIIGDYDTLEREVREYAETLAER